MDRPSDVRNRILEAALALLSERGFIELTQPRIAKAANVRQSHLTYYFPTRSDLLQGVAVHSIGILLQSLSAGAAKGGLTTEALASNLGKAIADKRRTRVMLGLVVSSDEDREIKVFLRDFIDKVRRDIANIVVLLGREPDEFHIALFHSLLVGATVLNLARDDAGSRKECAEVARFAVNQFLFSTQVHA